MHQQFQDPLTIAEMAGMTGMNNFHFIRTFKKNFNISPYHFLTCIRVYNAKRMLIETHLPISEISLSCGFKSASRFAAVFCRDTGQTPSRYRHTIRQTDHRPGY
jgi:transcriptional regulator GlxA family with amidase domain